MVGKETDCTRLLMILRRVHKFRRHRLIAIHRDRNRTGRPTRIPTPSAKRKAGFAVAVSCT